MKALGSATAMSVAVVSLVAFAARADDTSDLEGLLARPVVTTASKAAESASDAPATSVTITAEELHRYGLRTLDAAIRFLSFGANVDDDSTWHPSFGARGVHVTLDRNNHVLVLLDGHVMNDQVAGAIDLDHGLGVPIELVDHIEVIQGPGSVLYGSNAMLGVIHIFTKRAREFRGAHFVAESQPFSSVRGAAGFGHEFTLFGQTAEVTFGADYYASRRPISFPRVYGGLDAVTGRPIQYRPGGPADGIWGGTWTHNDARGPAAYLRVMSGNFELAARASAFHQVHPLLPGDFDNPDAGERTRGLSVDLKYTTTVSAAIDVKTRVYADVQDYSIFIRSQTPQSCLPGQVNGCNTDLLSASRALGAELQTTVDWLEDRRLVTLLGADGRVRDLAYTGDTTDRLTGDNPGSVAHFSGVDEVLGVYLQQTARLVSPLVLNAGARLDTTSRFGTALSPRVAAVVTPWEDATLKLIYSSAFRAPSAAEKSAAVPLYLVPAGELKAETVDSVEASFEQRFRAQRILATVFRSQWNDLIGLTSLSRAEAAAAKVRGDLVPYVPDGLQYRNATTIDNYGITIGYEGALVQNRLNYGVNATVSRAVQSAIGGGPSQRLANSPQVFGNARISYNLGEPWPTVAVASYAAGTSPVHGANPNAYPRVPYGPTTLLLQGTISGPVPALRGLLYFASARVSTTEHTSQIAGAPLRATSQNPPDPLLWPVEQFRTTVGLQYDLEM